MWNGICEILTLLLLRFSIFFDAIFDNGLHTSSEPLPKTASNFAFKLITPSLLSDLKNYPISKVK